MSFTAAVSSTSHFVAFNLSNTLQDLLFALALPEYLVIEVKSKIKTPLHEGKIRLRRAVKKGRV